MLPPSNSLADCTVAESSFSWRKERREVEERGTLWWWWGGCWLGEEGDWGGSQYGATVPPSGQQRLYADEGNSLVTNLFPFQSSFFFYIRQITCSSVLFSEEYQRSLPSCLHTGQMLYHTAKQGFYFERLDFFAPLVVSHSALCVCVCVFVCARVWERRPNWNQMWCFNPSQGSCLHSNQGAWMEER